ncbi:membrane protein [Vibrio inusitatus NBRC 102082]|uniref:Membrane protein n=1 Tax=Vibrio inusitatus NBRC 102082 TaxID=1219070 RepID=A0A4Y3I1C0_9VIBR|nr:general stress protein [Vibrio inusitatus]GEA52264.1 membrane protein [Vibrio inusitatus NBRC 102082]
MKQNKVVAVIDTHKEAELTVATLADNGFDINHISIIGKGYQSVEHATGFYNTGDRVKSWGKSGALWGGLWGALVGSGMFWIPTFGALVVAGPLVSALVGAIEGAVVTGSMTALGGALMSVGIPKDSVIKYEAAIKTDKYLVVMDLDEDEIERSKELLSKHDISFH